MLFLSQFLTTDGKMLNRRVTGECSLFPQTVMKCANTCNDSKTYVPSNPSTTALTCITTKLTMHGTDNKLVLCCNGIVVYTSEAMNGLGSR